MLVLQDQEWLSVWEKSALMHTRPVDEQPSKRSKKNDDKSAVAMLKKSVWHESVLKSVINYDYDRSVRPDKNRDHDLKRGPSEHRASNARQLGCVCQDMKPPKFFFFGRAQMCRNQSNV